MSFQLPLGSKIIAAQFWSPDFWGCRGFWITFNRIPIESCPEPSTPPKQRLQIWTAIIFDPRGSWKLIFGDCVAQGHCLKFLEPIFMFSIFRRFFLVFENLHLEKSKIPPKIHNGKPYSNHSGRGGNRVRICKKWRHLEPLRFLGGALGGPRAPATQKTIALSIPAT